MNEENQRDSSNNHNHENRDVSNVEDKSDSAFQIIIGPEESKEYIKSRGSLITYQRDQASAARLETIKRQSISMLNNLTLLRRSSIQSIVTSHAAEERRMSQQRVSILQLKSITNSSEKMSTKARRSILQQVQLPTNHRASVKVADGYGSVYQNKKQSETPQVHSSIVNIEQIHHNDNANQIGMDASDKTENDLVTDTDKANFFKSNPSAQPPSVGKNCDFNASIHDNRANQAGSSTCQQNSQLKIVPSINIITHMQQHQTEDDLLSAYVQHNSIQFFHKSVTSEFWFKLSKHPMYSYILGLFLIYCFCDMVLHFHASVPGNLLRIFFSVVFFMSELSRMDKKVFSMNLKIWDSLWMLFNAILFVLCDPIARIGVGIDADVNGYVGHISNGITLSMILFVFIQADANMGSSKQSRFAKSCALLFVSAYLCYFLFYSPNCSIRAVDGRVVDTYSFVLFDINFTSISKGACANLLIFSLNNLISSHISPYSKQTLKSPVYLR
jgi:hypothetical protein